MALMNEIKKCRSCGSNFSPKKGVSYRQWNNSFWCSRKCYSNSLIGKKLSEEHRKNISNGNVGKIITKDVRDKISSSNKGKKRTPEQIKTLSEAHKGIPSPLSGLKRPNLSGEKHWMWKGGISKGYKTGYYSIEYKNWRKLVFERDNYMCRECGKTGYLTAHHIKSQAYFPELRFEIDNGLTLCESCHAMTDNYKGRAKRINLC